MPFSIIFCVLIYSYKQILLLFCQCMQFYKVILKPYVRIHTLRKKITCFLFKDTLCLDKHFHRIFFSFFTGAIVAGVLGVVLVGVLAALIALAVQSK